MSVAVFNDNKNKMPMILVRFLLYLFDHMSEFPLLALEHII